ncbi:glutamate mutase L [Caloramator sp. mosi_1]|uniref:glutamate mutase L n=1 Tax=Caloramator sp. mosi_1 TaxID=3023090 RepID=UPI003081B492
MKVDVLVAEIGSTTTVVNAFDLKKAEFIGQGQGPTTVLDGDVTIGLNMALEDLKTNIGVNTIEYDDFWQQVVRQVD